MGDCRKEIILNLIEFEIRHKKNCSGQLFDRSGCISHLFLGAYLNFILSFWSSGVVVSVSHFRIPNHKRAHTNTHGKESEKTETGEESF